MNQSCSRPSLLGLILGIIKGPPNKSTENISYCIILKMMKK